MGNSIIFYIPTNMTRAEKQLPAKERKKRQQQLRVQWDMLPTDAQEQWSVESIPPSVSCCLLVRLLCLPVCRASPSAVLVRLHVWT